MMHRLAWAASLFVALGANSCKPSDPCDGASSIDVVTKVTGSFTLSAKSTWAKRNDADSFEIYIADYDQDPKDLRKSLSVQEGSLVRLSIFNMLGKPIVEGTTHTWRNPETPFMVDLAQRKQPNINLWGVVFDDSAKGTVTVKRVTDTMVCGDVDITDGHTTIKGRFAAPFAPRK